MKCYDKITRRIYESSHDIIEEANKWFAKTKSNKLIGTLDEYYIWLIDMFSDCWLDITNKYTIDKKLFGGSSIGVIKIDTEIDQIDNTPMIVMDFIIDSN